MKIAVAPTPSSVDLPHLLPLTGTDAYHTCHDSTARASIASFPGNICRLVVTLEKSRPITEVAADLSMDPLLRWASSLKLDRHIPGTVPRWVAGFPTEVITVHEGRTEVSYSDFCTRLLNPHVSSPIAFDLVELSGSIQLIFSWHHALLDAHGAELFISYLGHGIERKATRLFGDERQPREPILASWRNFSRIICSRFSPPFATLTARPDMGGPHHTSISFRDEECRSIEKRALEYGLEMFQSCFVLGAALFALESAHVFPDTHDWVVPIPRDHRKNLRPGPIFSNQISALFFRIPRIASRTLSESIKAVFESMQSIVAGEESRHYLDFMELARRLPRFLLSRVLAHPSRGKEGSFFFSDIGETFRGVTHLWGCALLTAEHVPPHFLPPGFTLVWSKFRGTALATIVSDGSVVTNRARERFIEKFCCALIGREVRDAIN